ncbi:MAG: hypothetical protein ACP5KG_04340 [Myxococcota bacterium]
MKTIRITVFAILILFFSLIIQYCSSGDESGNLQHIRDTSTRDVFVEDIKLDGGNVEDITELQIADEGADVCKPDCEGKECGDNGCGGVCGDCGANAECLDGQCKCMKKYDDCNQDWSDGCEVNFYTDPNNCGKCGSKCNVQNVKTVLCEDMICTYDECIPPYIDGDFDKKNGCEMYFYWPFRYGTVAQESGRAVIETRDKGFLIVGTTNLRGSGNTDFLINKADPYGNTIWQKILGGDKDDFAVSVVENGDGDYLIGGYSNSFGAGGYDIWLVLFDATGNIKWQRSYGGANDDRLFAIRAVPDGYIISGTYNASCSTCSAIWVFKIDKNGEFIWQKQFGSTNDSGAFNLDISTNGEILIAGAINTGCQICYDAIFMRLAQDGSKIVGKQVGSSDNIERGYAISSTIDDGAILSGEIPVTGNGLDVFLMKFDKAGNVIWQRTYGGPDNQRPYQLIRTPNNNFMLLAETMFYGAGQYDCFLLKADSYGNVIWQKTYGGDKIDRCYSIYSVSDGGYILTGESYSFDTSLEMVVYKTDKDGVSMGVCPDGLGKSVSVKVATSNIPVKDLNIQSYDTSAATMNTNAYVDISGITNKMLCKEK